MTENGWATIWYNLHQDHTHIGYISSMNPRHQISSPLSKILVGPWSSVEERKHYIPIDIPKGINSHWYPIVYWFTAWGFTTLIHFCLLWTRSGYQASELKWTRRLLLCILWRRQDAPPESIKYNIHIHIQLQLQQLQQQQRRRPEQHQEQQQHVHQCDVIQPHHSFRLVSGRTVNLAFEVTNIPFMKGANLPVSA